MSFANKNFLPYTDKFSTPQHVHQAPNQGVHEEETHGWTNWNHEFIVVEE